MKRSFVIMVISIFILTLVSGCTKEIPSKANITNNNSGKGGNLTIMVAADPPKSGEKTVADVLDDINKLMNKENPEMSITIERVPEATYQKELENSLAAGKGPDIFFVPSVSLLNKYQGMGYLEDMNSLTQTEQIQWENYFSTGLMDLVTVNDKVVGLPTTFAPAEILYWKSVFDKADLSYPTPDWTWDQFLKSATRLNESAKEHGGKGTVFPINLSNIEVLINANGGTMLSPDNLTTSGYIDSPASLDAINKVATAVRTSVISLDWDVTPADFLIDKSIGMTFLPRRSASMHILIILLQHGNSFANILWSTPISLQHWYKGIPIFLKN